MKRPNACWGLLQFAMVQAVIVGLAWLLGAGHPGVRSQRYQASTIEIIIAVILGIGGFWGALAWWKATRGGGL